jgi:hypothetical protein
MVRLRGFSPEPKKFGTEAHTPLPSDSSPCINAKGMKHIQQIVGSILYYARAVDMTVLMAFSLIAVKQMKATEKNGPMHLIIGIQLLDYLLGHSNAKVQSHASDMLLNIHLDAPYLSEAKASRREHGDFFMGWICQRRGSLFV